MTDSPSPEEWFVSRMQAEVLGRHKNFIHLKRLRDSLIDQCPCSLTAMGQLPN